MDVKLPVFKGRGGGDLSNEYFHYNRAIIHVEREMKANLKTWRPHTWRDSFSIMARPFVVL